MTKEEKRKVQSEKSLRLALQHLESVWRLGASMFTCAWIKATRGEECCPFYELMGRVASNYYPSDSIVNWQWHYVDVVGNRMPCMPETMDELKRLHGIHFTGWDNCGDSIMVDVMYTTAVIENESRHWLAENKKNK